MWGGREEEGPNALTLASRKSTKKKKKWCLHAFIVVVRRTFSSEREKGREFKDGLVVSESCRY